MNVSHVDPLFLVLPMFINPPYFIEEETEVQRDEITSQNHRSIIISGEARN